MSRAEKCLALSVKRKHRREIIAVYKQITWVNNKGRGGKLIQRTVLAAKQNIKLVMTMVKIK